MFYKILFIFGDHWKTFKLTNKTFLTFLKNTNALKLKVSGTYYI